LAPIKELATQLRKFESELAQTRELVVVDDPEMAAEARAEEERLVAQIAQLEAELTPLLLPRDPMDDRPAIVEIRDDQRARPNADLAANAAWDSGEVGMGLDERYLRVVLSGVTRFAGIQEVAMTLSASAGAARGGRGDAVGGGAAAGEVVITESARGGVFDPILLPRMQTLVAILAEWDIRHIDFGEIVEAPSGFDAASYAERFGSVPVIANYLFYPQPPTTVSTVVLCREASSLISSP